MCVRQNVEELDPLFRASRLLFGIWRQNLCDNTGLNVPALVIGNLFSVVTVTNQRSRTRSQMSQPLKSDHVFHNIKQSLTPVNN